jgi:hypothetical protein
MTTVFLEKPDLFISLSGAIRSHLGIPIASFVGEPAPVVEISNEVEVFSSSVINVPVRPHPDLLVTYLTSEINKDVFVDNSDLVGDVAGDTEQENVSGNESEISELTDGEFNVAEKSIETKSDGLVWKSQPIIDKIEGQENIDDEVNIDMSAYLPGGSTSISNPDLISGLYEPSTIDAADYVSVVEEVEDITSNESAVEEDFDLVGFNPMKYLSGGAGITTPVSHLSASPEPVDELGDVMMAPVKRDPLSLLRELSSLSR